MVTALALGVALTACGSHVEPVAPHASTAIVVPGYVAPSDSTYWKTVLSSAPAVRDVILNPSDGPGTDAQPAYRQLITRLRATGIRVLGYVRTGQGDRSATDVETDAAHWASFYGVRSLFFDEASSKAADEARYRDYVATVHKAGGVAVLNPGVVPAQGYFAFADAVVTFEDSAQNYLTGPADPDWLATEPRGKVWNIVIGVSPDQLPTVVGQAAAHHAGEMYVTDDDKPNPYDTLPSYWSREVAGMPTAETASPASWTGRLPRVTADHLGEGMARRQDRPGPDGEGET